MGGQKRQRKPKKSSRIRGGGEHRSMPVSLRLHKLVQTDVDLDY